MNTHTRVALLAAACWLLSSVTACSSGGAALRGAAAPAPTAEPGTAPAYPGPDASQVLTTTGAVTATAASELGSPFSAEAGEDGQATGQGSAEAGAPSGGGAEAAVIIEPQAAWTAEACIPLLKSYLEALKYLNRVEHQLVMVKTNGLYTGYGEGPMSSGFGESKAVGRIVPVLTSDWTQMYFSDRRFLTGNCRAPCNVSYPFDPARRDRIGLVIDSASGWFTVTFPSWNNAKVTVKPTCSGNIMRGTADGSEFLLTLRNTTLGTPK